MSTDVAPWRIDYDDESHKYWIDGEEVRSVSWFLDKTTSKDALPWWGMRVGMAAVVHLLAKTGWATIAAANSPAEIIAGAPEPGRIYYTRADVKQRKPKTLVEALTLDEKRTTNHIKDEAAERGTSIHAALEALGEGVIPSPLDFPEAQRGYIAALVSWYLDHEPVFVEQEVIVASKELMYAGRFDLVVDYQAGPHAGQRALVDLKTSKAVYITHLFQLAGYRCAYYEMGLHRREGHRAFDVMQVLHAGVKTGRYTLVESNVDESSWRNMVHHGRSLQAEIDLHKGRPGLQT